MDRLVDHHRWQGSGRCTSLFSGSQAMLLAFRGPSFLGSRLESQLFQWDSRCPSCLPTQDAGVTRLFSGPPSRTQRFLAPSKGELVGFGILSHIRWGTFRVTPWLIMIELG